MTWIPTQPHPWDYEPAWSHSSSASITVYALRENKRPVGFAPWPAQEREKKRKKKVKS